MSKMKDLYTLLEEPVKAASRRASNNWYGLMEPDEIEQELWVEILESPATSGKLADSDPNHITDLLARMADRICIKERDAYEHFTGNYRYSVNEAKVLVEEYFLRNGEELMIEIVDVEVAYGQMTETNPNYAEAVFRKFALGEPVDSGWERDRLSRGLTKLTDLMNRNFKERERDYRDGPGTKPRIPNGYDPYEG